MLTFAKRTMRLYFRDKASVFFSLLAVFIIIGIYILFLGDAWSQGMEFENADVIMDAWIMSGLLAVVSFTTTMGAFGIMVDDRYKKISKDFYSSPIKRSHLAAGYIIGAFMIGLIMSLLTFVLVQLYMISNGAAVPDFYSLAKLLGLIVLSTATNTAILFFIVSFLKSQNAFGTASSIIGTFIGFLTGIYMPIGVLPDAVQTVVKVFPVSHTATLFRQIMMEPFLNEAFNGAPDEIKADFYKEMGITLSWSGNTIPWYVSIIIIVATSFLFFGLSVLSISRKSK
ncbi:MAG TPA: ABC transporter [Clostridiales bacterium]|nr:ABC transporter [Clostridiales bacterium]